MTEMDQLRAEVILLKKFRVLLERIMDAKVNMIPLSIEYWLLQAEEQRHQDNREEKPTSPEGEETSHGADLSAPPV